MFIVDTNVLSEFRKAESGKADPNVMAWGRRIQASTLFLSAMTVLELEHGALLLERRDPAQGRRLRDWLTRAIYPSFGDRILPVDGDVARRCAVLNVPDRRPERDSLIAATALVHGMVVATRNVADFRPMGVPVVNPWHA